MFSSSREGPGNPSKMNPIRDNLIDQAKLICEKQITELFKVWDETGIRHEVLNTYADQVLNHLIGLMKDMVEESVQKKKDFLKSVKSLLQLATKLSKELDVTFATEPYDDLPLMELEYNLKEQVEHLRRLKEERLKYINELTAKEADICKKLGAKPTGFDSELPSEQKIKEFENYLHLQELEKDRLSEMFKDARRAIIKMMEELKINPALDFEKAVFHDHNNFIYSTNNMNKLKDLRERLKEQVEQAKYEVKEKKESLMALWDYLDEPIEKREAFIEAYTGYNLYTINALNAEIKRCKQKRSENVANYVKKIRKEIESLWELCKYSEFQKKAFAAMKCHTYTEDLLTLHEMEAENLRKYYNSNRKFFELLNEWEVQFQKLKDLDQRANDPDRYHNRGGQLLMEEKERKTVEKKLPKLETQLFTLVDEYEEKQKKPFLVHGQSLKDFLEDKQVKYEEEKENLKMARKQAKDKSMRKTPMSTSKRTPMAASMLRITPASNRLRTPGRNVSRMTPAAKRKLPYDSSPNTSENKKRAVHIDKHNKPTLLHNKVRKSTRLSSNGITHNGVAPNGSGRVVKKGASKKKRRSKSDTMLSVSSYGNFQEHLENRDELRSSILPEQVLKKPPIKIVPVNTPVKPTRKKLLAVSTPSVANSTRTLQGTPKNPRYGSTPRLIPVKNSSPVNV